METKKSGLAGAAMGAAIGSVIAIPATPILWYLFCMVVISLTMDWDWKGNPADIMYGRAAVPGCVIIFFSCGGLGALIGSWIDDRAKDPNEPSVLKAPGALLFGLLGGLTGGWLGSFIGMYIYMVGVLASQDWTSLIYVAWIVGVLVGVSAGLLITRSIARRRAQTAQASDT